MPRGAPSRNQCTSRRCREHGERWPTRANVGLRDSRPFGNGVADRHVDPLSRPHERCRPPGRQGCAATRRQWPRRRTSPRRRTGPRCSTPWRGECRQSAGQPCASGQCSRTCGRCPRRRQRPGRSRRPDTLVTRGHLPPRPRHRPTHRPSGGGQQRSPDPTVNPSTSDPHFDGCLRTLDRALDAEEAHSSQYRPAHGRSSRSDGERQHHRRVPGVHCSWDWRSKPVDPGPLDLSFQFAHVYHDPPRPTLRLSWHPPA